MNTKRCESILRPLKPLDSRRSTAPLLGFPKALHDDQVDSTSQALNWLTSRKPPNRPIVRRDIPRRDIIARRDII
jgi:hypothetical protein